MTGVSMLAGLMLLVASGEVDAQWYVLCDTGSGEVVTAQEIDEAVHIVMNGPLPGPRLAGIWLEDNCPEQRCTADGRCLSSVVPADESPQPTASAWVAGELSTVTVGSRKQVSRQLASPPSGPLSGPGRADLGPLIATAKAAAAACSYPAALAAANHLTNFNPENPWLQANHDILQRLAARQTATEQAVWRASSQLEAGRLKEAYKLAIQAADTAVSCQSQAVSNLVTGIDTAIEQRRMERDAARRKVAASLLPGLLDLARIASGGQAAPGGSAAVVGGMVQSAGSAAMGIDPCAFRLEYNDPESLIPMCTCAGYAFDLRSFRCLPGGG